MVNPKPEERPTSDDSKPAEPPESQHYWPDPSQPKDFGVREADRVRERYPSAPAPASRSMRLIAAVCFLTAFGGIAVYCLLRNNPPAELEDTEPASTASKPDHKNLMPPSGILPRRERNDPGLSHPVHHVKAQRLDHIEHRRLPKGDNPYRVVLYLHPELNPPAEDYAPYRVWITADFARASADGYIKFVDAETGGHVTTRFDSVEQVRPGTLAADGDGRPRDNPFRPVPPIWRGEGGDLPDGQAPRAPRPPREPVPDPNR